MLLIDDELLMALLITQDSLNSFAIGWTNDSSVFESNYAVNAEHIGDCLLVLLS
jgi:hypothetical protein